MRGLRTTLAQTITDPAELDADADGPAGGAGGVLRAGPAVVRAAAGHGGARPDVRPGHGPHAAQHGGLQPDRGHRAGAAAQHDAAADDVAAHHRGVRAGARASGWPRAWARGLDRFVSWVVGDLLRAARAGGPGILLILVFGFALRCCRPAACSARRRPRTRWAASLDLLYHAILPILTLVIVSIGPVDLRGAHDDDDRRPGRPRDARPRQGHGRADRRATGTSCGSRRRPS